MTRRLLHPLVRAALADRAAGVTFAALARRVFTVRRQLNAPHLDQCDRRRGQLVRLRAEMCQLLGDALPHQRAAAI